MLLLSFWTCLAVQAQTSVYGTVEDGTGKSVPGASVTLLRAGKPLKFTKTDARGAFRMNIGELQKADSLQIGCIGFAKTVVKPAEKGATNVKLAAKPFELNEVTVRGGRIFGRQDTTVYDLTRFANERDNSLKDVLKKTARRRSGVERRADCERKIAQPIHRGRIGLDRRSIQSA